MHLFFFLAAGLVKDNLIYSVTHTLLSNQGVMKARAAKNVNKEYGNQGLQLKPGFLEHMN